MIDSLNKDRFEKSPLKEARMKTTHKKVENLRRSQRENTKSIEQLRKEVNALLKWLKKNITTKPLPCGCSFSPKGEFVHEVLSDGTTGTSVIALKIRIGEKHSEAQLHKFCALIADGFLDQLIERLELQTKRFTTTSKTITEFVALKGK